MTLLKWSAKDPADVCDYWFDWGSDDLPAESRFLPAAETITDATVTVPAEETQPDPPETSPYDYLVGDTQSYDTKAVRVRLSGGVPGTYTIDCIITTSDGQVFEITKTLTVKERVK